MHIKLLALVSLFFTLVSPLTAYAGKCKDEVRLLLVDGYSSGSLVPDAFRQHVQDYAPNMGTKVYHVHSDREPIPLMAPSFAPSKFDSDYRHDNSLSGPNYRKLREVVKTLAPRVIMAGTESGVLLADQLAWDLRKDLGLMANPVNPALRDKYLMQMVLKDAGLNYIPTLKTNNLAEGLAFVKRENLLPGIVVIKPYQSAGTDGLHYARSEEEFRYYFNSLVGSKDQWGHLNDQILVQKYVGKGHLEWVPNGVSFIEHHFTDLWTYEKEYVEGGGEVYRFDLLQEFDGEVQKQIVDYTIKVLDAFKHKYGATHPEVKWTENGPVLIEVGRRFMGSRQPRVVKEAGLLDQVTGSLEVYLDFLHPGLFKSRPQGYNLRKYAAVVQINSDQDGVLFSSAMDNSIKQLPGYIRHALYYKDGDPVKKTVDMNTALGQVELVANSKEELMTQINRIREWEKTGLFKKNRPTSEAVTQ